MAVAQADSSASGVRRRFLDPKRLFPSWPGPTLDGNPMLWREWHHNRPSRVARRLWAGLFVVCSGMVAWGTLDAVARGVPDGSEMLQSGLGFMSR